MPYNNILIIQTAFIGDAILASSLVEKLHDEWPQARISILVRKGNESIYNNHPFLIQVLVWNKQESKIKNLFQLILKIRKLKFDCVINCHRFASSGLIASFSGAKHVAGYKENPFSFLFNYNIKHVIGNGKHEVERYNDLVQDFCKPVLYKPKLYPSITDSSLVEQYKNVSYVCIAPASVWFTKQLPVKKWVELISKIDTNKTIYLIGAPSDFKLCEEIISLSKRSLVVNLAGKLSLLQSCALMKDAQMNYVNDSAPLHLASSVNAVVTAFFLSTTPNFGFGPLSDNKTIIENKNLACRPCGLHGHKQCPKQHFECATHLEI